MSAGKLPRTLRLDPSDTFVFARAAEAGEWAVTGSFLFFDADLSALAGKERAAFRSGFVGVRSLGFSTLVVVSEASDAERAARRLEKKSRARLTMKMEKQKEVLDKRLKLAGKGGSAESKKYKAGKNDGGKSKKTRTRSDAMIKKKNTKKAIA